MSVRLTGPAQREPRLDVPLLRRRAQRMLREIGHARSELSLALVDDAEIAQLNGDYRGRPRPTDVLSFSLVEGPHRHFRGQLLGDVVISLDTARLQARERRRGLDEVVGRLVVHGVLHLIGYDHEDDAEAKAMQLEERRLWSAAVELQ